MWKLGNRVVIVLVCMLSGSVIFYNIWGSVLSVIITLLVIYASVLLLANANIQTPHALLLQEYIERTGEKLYNLLRNISCQTTTYIFDLIDIVKTFYQNYIISKMDRRRGNTYQLSTDTLVNSNKNLEFNMIEGLTPISKNRRRSYISGSENCGIDSINSRGYDGAKSLNKVTSTPLTRWEKRVAHNGDINYRDTNTTNDEIALTRSASFHLNDYATLREEQTVYSPRGSPWGTSISPKMRSRAGGVKTVQTVAGPLLTSTRYNIDPKVYTDVTSPGLTSRLSKYAAEADMKLIHQSQYSAGQFPKVNLNASPTPIVNTRSPRSRTSVTVRVAPPETTKYSPPDRQKILSTMCQTKNETPPSVVQVLKEISLKRHASRDDIAMEIAKKQRTDGIYNDESENYKEMSQKREREDLSKFEGDISIENSSLRPNKRTKMPSCYDIINSLSSSTNVSSGVKRKADISRSGTPDIGKHFKSLDNIQRSRSFSTSPQQNMYKIQSDLVDNELDNSATSKKQLDSPKVISPFTNNLKHNTVENEKKLNSNNEIKLTDRLFMKAEPQNIDKLKSLIEEHENVTSKFTADYGDEIKKSDVVIMRQTSMKARLKSMFDAISGKASGQIDPNVVIQAEQVNNSSATTSLSSVVNQQSLSALTTLNSSTSTTSINTSPISTSAVVPIIGKPKTSTTPGKHVTFMLPISSTQTTNNTISSTTGKSSISLSTSSQQKTEFQKCEIKDNTTTSSSLFSVPSPANSSSLPVFGSPTSSISVPIVSNQSSMSTPNSSAPNASSTLRNISQSFTSPSIKPALTISFGTSTSTAESKMQPNALTAFTMTSTKSIATTTAATTASFVFGTPTIVSTLATTSATTSTTISQSTPMPSFQSTTSASTIATPTTNLFAADKSTISFGASVTTSTSAITTPVFSFGASSNNSLSEQSTGNSQVQGTFSFGATTIPTNNLSTTTTTQSQVSTKPETVTTTTPSTFAFGGNNSNETSSVFGSNISNTSKSVLSFGSNTTSTTITTSNTPITTTPSMFSFGGVSSGSKPAFSFNATNDVAISTAPNNMLTFGTPTQQTAPLFKSNDNNSSLTTTSAQNPPLFGSISTAGSQSNATPGSNTMPFTFGTPNTQQSTFSAPTISTTTSGNTTIPQFSITPKSTKTPTFGMNPTLLNSATNISDNSNTSVTATTSASLFSANTSNNIFGQSKIMSPAGTFGTQSSTSSNFTTNTTNNFGNTSQPLSFGTQQPITTTNFGTTQNSINITTPTFGTTNITTPGISTTTANSPPAFNASNSTSTSSGFGTLKSIVPTFSSTSPDFSSSKPTQSLFGTQNPNPTTTFHTTTTAFGTGASITSSSTAPTFGTATSSTSTFGSSSGFGNSTAPPPPPAFGSSMNNTTFSGGFGGTNAANTSSLFGNQSANSPTFGSSTPSLPSFGTVTNNTTPSSSGTFSFGNTAGNQSQPQNSPFTFGGANTNNNNTNNNNATNSPTPFQFGASSPQTGGFNFTSGSAPSFGGSNAGGSNTGNVGGMFSIGSGSTAPRSRSIRTRRQR